MPHDKRAKAEKLFLAGEMISTIAAKIGVNRRTIERWANDGAWREKRDVVPIAEARSNPDAPTPIRSTSAPTRKYQGLGIDELELVDIALSDVSAVMGRGDLDARAIGSCATALCKLIELRLKLKPRTAAQLAELAISSGVTPQEFVNELKRQGWQQQRA